MSSIEVTTNFKDSDGVDLGKKLITKDYLMSVYPSIAQELGITPELWVWGINSNNQLGTNNATNSSTPVTTFSGGTNWKNIAKGGGTTTAAIKTDGTLWVWGSGSNGRLGNNSISNVSTPITTFSGGNDWRQVSCSPLGGTFTGHVAAIKTDGTLWVWGDNANGQLGTNNAIDGSTPTTTFAGGNDWKQVSCGYSHTAAIKTDGTLWVWGSGSNCQLGINSTSSRSTPTTTFAGGNDWKQVSCGQYYVTAIKADGTLWVWGINSSTQLGTNDNIIRSTPVTTFAGGNDWKQVEGGSSHTAAIKTDGTLWTWGANNNGQLGINSIATRSTPVTTFSGGTNWKQVDCGSNNNTVAIKTDGTLWIWGFNSNGQLGINNTSQINTPVTTFAGGTNWKQVSSGHAFTMAIESTDVI